MKLFLQVLWALYTVIATMALVSSLSALKLQSMGESYRSGDYYCAPLKTMGMGVEE